MRFVAYLAGSGLSHTMISSYLSGLRFAQIAHGWPEHQFCNYPQLHSTTSSTIDPHPAASLSPPTSQAHSIGSGRARGNTASMIRLCSGLPAA